MSRELAKISQNGKSEFRWSKTNHLYGLQRLRRLQKSNLLWTQKCGYCNRIRTVILNIFSTHYVSERSKWGRDSQFGGIPVSPQTWTIPSGDFSQQMSTRPILPVSSFWTFSSFHPSDCQITEYYYVCRC